MAELRSTDFLPKRFHGDVINADLARAHFLAFTDYLEAHDLLDPVDDDAFQAVVSTFKRTLHGTTRIWIEGKVFQDLANLRTSFLARFSESSSHYALTRQFTELNYVPGDTAEVFLASIRKLALLLGYTDLQVRDKFLNALPGDCRSAVLMSTDGDANIDELVQKAQCYLDLQKYSESADTSSKSSASATADNALPTQNQSSDISDLCNKIDSLLDDRARQPAKQANSSSSSRQRYNSRDSRRQGSRRQFQERSNSRFPFTGVCFYCNTPGHRARDCFLRRHHQQLQYGPPSFPPPMMEQPPMLPPRGPHFQ
ncbi:hypothetical protein HOLleu_15662 [Holothuria leucospilota]|uniref:CCHC-type domain-containing protein n=1 Tax=Holothuria leucospilota TaxID=206669 RepID=A0A9Q1C317_HOLLE|nr:hypothetical protein HOLleu_15662 [Holothuria leucospilota]